MKKTYMAPTVVVMEIANKEQLMNVSGGTTGIGYGGIDTSGTLEPSSRELDEFFSNWDDDNY